MTVSIELKSSGHYTSLRDAETLIRESGKLFLHPISETHQFRPTLTYMDALTRKSRRRGGGFSDDESDGPPPDPDEPAPPEATWVEQVYVDTLHDPRFGELRCFIVGGEVTRIIRTVPRGDGMLCSSVDDGWPPLAEQWCVTAVDYIR